MHSNVEYSTLQTACSKSFTCGFAELSIADCAMGWAQKFAQEKEVTAIE